MKHCKKKPIHKEGKHERELRNELKNAVCTRIIPNKTKYTRKNKHKQKTHETQ